MIPGLGLVVMLACVVFYYRLGESEYDSGLAIAGLSLMLWLGGAYLLHFGLLGCILTQGVLFAGLTVWNATRK